jgi:exopolyphosphatase/guanosine-5'-triphosphate,3'-diphosphate pyrophosphatase
MSKNRFGIIDIGSNSVHLEVAEFREGSLNTICTDRVVTRLGAGVATTNQIEKHALDETVATIGKFIKTAKKHGAKKADLKLIATAAARQAENGSELVDLVRSSYDMLVEIISPEQEANYALRGVAHRYPIEHHSIGVIDIGGGSTEIITAVDGDVTLIASLPFGAVTLSSQFDLHDVIDPSRYKNMENCIYESLSEHMSQVAELDSVYATGGACTAMAAIEMHRDERDLIRDDALDGYVLTLQSIKDQLELLCALDATGRSNLDGLSPKRSEIIVAGATVTKLVLDRLRTDSMIIHTGGIKLGVLLEMSHRT